VKTTDYETRHKIVFFHPPVTSFLWSWALGDQIITPYR